MMFGMTDYWLFMRLEGIKEDWLKQTRMSVLPDEHCINLIEELKRMLILIIKTSKENPNKKKFSTLKSHRSALSSSIFL